MQIMRASALRTRAASVRRDVGKAACAGCGGQIFYLVVLDDCSTEAVCLNKDCRQVWSTSSEGQGTIVGISKALAERRHEPADLVSEAKRRTIRDRAMECPECEARRAGAAERQKRYRERQRGGAA